MNPEDEHEASISKEPRRKRVFQRRLLAQLSESRMLEVLDRTLHNNGNQRHHTGLSNQEQDEQDSREEDQEREEEEELVCVSKMVKMNNSQPTLSKSSGFQAGGVLKTVRYIHMQRAIQSEQHENQADC
ncbi:hypothetical protein PHMEG_00041001 [Phytophthora megakarya]|uniref:Uncharacterized protein n=1 Tax=Phytophthora megakarya TaxID=4795 RepID=A0A225UCG2_9STRA|nr:hypothetical protein PHMEG_00041001 [Phytophthora megakarya]